MEYHATHTVPDGGLPAWTEPNGAAPPATDLGAGLDVQVVERRDAWARVVASNGWSGWVDATRLRELVAVATAGAPTAAALVSPTPPPGSPALAAVAPATRSRGTGAGLAVGRILALIGGIVIVISSWLEWIGERAFSAASSGFDVPAEFLIDRDADLGGLSVGAIVVVAGLLVVVGVFIPRAEVLWVVGGVLAIAVGAVFAYQLDSLVGRIIDTDLADVMGPGAVACIIGGLVAVAGGVVNFVRGRP